ncbi:hypothetical protein DFH11DRAFT_6271 [Phellopilus nigrolimitatus]|nr:hypothetical protein DFH11DRAFT_6271 [Phellopilus nigrolimitatus]
MSSTNRTLGGNALYIGLFFREASALNPELFHWTLLAKTHDKPTGILIHAASPVGWAFEVKDYKFEASNTSVVAVKIGSLGSTISSEYLTQILRQVPIGRSMYEVPRVWNCRIWIRDAVRVLHQSKIINCPDVDALEAEVSQVGAVYRDGFTPGRGSWGSAVSSKSS